jgi:hypothetical protein
MESVRVLIKYIWFSPAVFRAYTIYSLGGVGSVGLLLEQPDKKHKQKQAHNRKIIVPLGLICLREDFKRIRNSFYLSNPPFCKKYLSAYPPLYYNKMIIFVKRDYYNSQEPLQRVLR